MYPKLYLHPGFAVYTHSYSFHPHVRLHAHSAAWTVRLLHQAGRNKYTYNPNMWGTPGMEPVTTCLASVYLLSKCILNQRSTIWAIPSLTIFWWSIKSSLKKFLSHYYVNKEPQLNLLANFVNILNEAAGGSWASNPNQKELAHWENNLGKL